MATTQEAIARLRMIFETQGADAAVAEMKKLETAETSLGTTSLNLDRSFANLERRYSETARATADYERAMKTLNAAVAQNPALAERAAAVQQTVVARYQATMQAAHQAAQSQTASGVAMQALAAQASAASASTGIFGSVLQTFGKGGAAAAIGIGALVLGIGKLDQGVHGFAQHARDIKNFADATGLTTAQVQGLNKEASRFGISTDEMHSALMRFTSTFDEVRGGGGALLETIRKIDSGLGEQAVSAANEEEALNVLAAAYRKAGNEFERARLLRAAFGRGGQAMAPLIENLDIGQITDKYAGRGLSEDIIKDLRRLEGEIATIGSNTSNKIYSLFAVPWLEAEKAVLKYFEAAAKGAISLIKGPQAPTSEDIPALLEQQQKLIENAERLQQLLNQPQGKGTFAAMMQELEKTKDSLKTVDYWLEKLRAAKPGGGLTSGEPSFEARAKDAQLLVQALGGLATVQEQVLAKTYQLETAYNQLSASGKARINEMREALEALMQVQAELSQVAPGTYERQLEAIQKIKTAYPELVAQDAIRMSQLEDQLRIAQALPGVAQMQAQEQARINQLLLQGKDLETATMMAGKERAVAQAEINSAADLQLQKLQEQYAVITATTAAERRQAEAQVTYNELRRQGVSEEKATAIAQQQMTNSQAQAETQERQQQEQINANARKTLAAMRDQYAVSAAITGAEKIAAQAVATRNQLMREGVSAGLASAIAAQQAENAYAAVNAAVARQIISLNDATSIIKAQTEDLREQANVAQKILGYNEMNARAQVAFNQAVREGASEQMASAYAAATMNNLLAQREQQQERAFQAEEQRFRQRQQQADQQAAQAVRAEEEQGFAEASARGEEINQRMRSAQTDSQQQMGELFRQLAQQGSQTAQQMLAMLEGEYGRAWLFNSDQLMAPLEKAKREVALVPQQQREQQAVDQLKSLQDQFRLGGAATDQEKAQIQWQLTYEKLIKEGVSASVAQQIANQELANTMQQLAKSVDANTSALQSQLDPIYTAGRAALRIGYYGEGSGGTQRIVTGTGYANENVPANAQPSGNNLIVINNNFAAGAVMGDRRTQYQAANAYGRAIAATGK